MSRVDLTVPDIGSAHDVDVVDVLVKPGDVVEVDTPLVTLETDKASMDVPSTLAGTVAEVLLKRGDKASAGTVIARVETNSQAGAGAPADGKGGDVKAPAAAAASSAEDATFAESFDAEELERTVTQPILKQGAVPPASSANGATPVGAARTESASTSRPPAASAASTGGSHASATVSGGGTAASGSTSASASPVSAREESAGDRAYWCAMA